MSIIDKYHRAKKPDTKLHTILSIYINFKNKLTDGNRSLMRIMDW